MNIQINEAFGPTIQGEGVEVGWPCYFLRTQICPVHCPGCDTAYTWNGKEKAKAVWSKDQLMVWFDEWFAENPKCGLVISGGEPLIHYANIEFIEFLEYVKSKTWVSLETSGFPGPKPIIEEPYEKRASFTRFLHAFTTIHCSPKITPCLHGVWTNEQLAQNIPLMMDLLKTDDSTQLAFKLVCKEQEDVDAIAMYDEKFGWQKKGYKVFLMPYGNNPEEIVAQCDKLTPALAKHGFKLSPRLHAIIWGNVRGK